MSKDPLSFEIYIFRNGQLDREHDRIIVLVMTSTWVQRSLVWVTSASACELCPKITVLCTRPRIAYE